MRRKIIFLISLIILTGIIYYHLTEEKIPLITAKITKVIDGDTVQTEDGTKIRLKGINTPEKEELYYKEAKEFLENLVLNKTVQIEDYGLDKYKRTLGYLYLEKSLINLQIVEEGLAYSFEYETDSHSKEIRNSEGSARIKELNLWKKSPNTECIKLINLQYIEPIKRCTNGEVLQIENLCDKNFDVTIKDDATHVYKEKILANSIFSKNFSCIWNDDGDSLYLRDDKGLLIFYRY